MKSKRWKRRNRHTRPEWVETWEEARLATITFKEWHYPRRTKDRLFIAIQGKNFAWVSFSLKALRV